MLNPWKVLGVHRTSTQQEIREAYLSIVRKVHPDMKKGNHDKCAAANDSYAVLTDKKRTNEVVRHMMLHYTLCQTCRGTGAKFSGKLSNRKAYACKPCGGSGMIPKKGKKV